MVPKCWTWVQHWVSSGTRRIVRDLSGFPRTLLYAADRVISGATLVQLPQPPKPPTAPPPPPEDLDHAQAGHTLDPFPRDPPLLDECNPGVTCHRDQHPRWTWAIGCWLNRRRKRGRYSTVLRYRLTALQSQKAVAAYLKSKQLLPFGFACVTPGYGLTP